MPNCNKCDKPYAIAAVSGIRLAILARALQEVLEKLGTALIDTERNGATNEPYSAGFVKLGSRQITVS